MFVLASYLSLKSRIDDLLDDKGVVRMSFMPVTQILATQMGKSADTIVTDLQSTRCALQMQIADDRGTFLASVERCNFERTAAHCNILQHTAIKHPAIHSATHCNTLQRTATHCDILGHTATHCNKLQNTATHCYTLKYAATHCNTLHNHTVCRGLSTSVTLSISVPVPVSVSVSVSASVSVSVSVSVSGPC